MKAKSISETSSGYLSEEHKRKFTITAGIIGALFFLGQFIFPFIAMLFMMPTMFIFQTDWMREADLSSAVELNNEAWYFENTVSSSKATSRLMKIDLKNFKNEPEFVKKIDIADPRLLVNNDKLWIISSNKVSVFQKGEISSTVETRQLSDISRPFSFNDKPAVLESTPDKLNLIVFSDNTWIVEKDLSYLQDSKRWKPLVGRHFKILSDSGKLHLFRQFGDTVYYIKGFPAKDDSRENWKPILPVSSSRWFPFILDGTPALFIIQKSEAPIGKLKAVWLKNGKWEEFFSHDSFIISKMAVFQGEKPDSFIMAIQSFPGSLKLQKVSNGKITEEARHGRNFPFPRGMMAMMFMPQLLSFLMPLLLACILSGFMTRDRVCIFQVGNSRMHFASLTKRALSQIIDAVVLGAPMGIAYMAMFHSFFDFEKMITFMMGPRILIYLGLMILGFFWIVFCFLIFSVLEGVYGLTPGKWVMGIRVLGTDMKPCGIGRAFIRNILKMVDGFFSFMVGIMIVAFTENWQRIGDMAARTVVLDKRKLN